MGLMPNEPLRYGPTNYYLIVALIVVGLNVTVLLNYYYGTFNRYPWNKLGVWALHVLVIAFLAGMAAFSFPYNKLRANNINQDYPYTLNDCLTFAAETAIWSVIISVVLSFFLKRKSTMNRYIPFKF